MTPRSRSQDLTADLLRDLEAEEAAPALPGPSDPPAGRPASPVAGTEPAPFVQTALYLGLRAWRRPAVSRTGGSVSVFAGPLRLQIGRRPS